MNYDIRRDNTSITSDLKKPDKHLLVSSLAELCKGKN